MKIHVRRLVVGLILAAVTLAGCVSYEPGEAPMENIWGSWVPDFLPEGWEPERYVFTESDMSFEIFLLSDGTNRGTYYIEKLTNYMIECVGALTMKYRMYDDNSRMKIWWVDGSGHSTLDDGHYIEFVRE